MSYILTIDGQCGGAGKDGLASEGAEKDSFEFGSSLL
jgi:hypothetical protein